MAEKVDLAEYLFRRLVELGCGSVHGVPGDYSIVALDYLEPAGLRWVGNANELNSGYAADGYARIKGIGALITSIGVGELSAINAIAGAYAEKVPVVHIVGTAPKAAQDSQACLHHTLGHGDLRVFSGFHKPITVAQANLNDQRNATLLIDATLRECILHSRPVYIELPTDMVKVRVDAPPGPIALDVPGNTESEDAAVDVLMERIKTAKQPLVLVDGFSSRFGIRDQINQLIKNTGFPSLTSPFGKGLIDENLDTYHGTYFGVIGDMAHQAWVKDCDLVLHFSPMKSDMNTFGFTAIPDSNATITFERYSIQFGGQEENIHPISIKFFLDKILKRTEGLERPEPTPFPPNQTLPRTLFHALSPTTTNAPIDQDSFWLRTSKFLVPDDIVLTETGTSLYSGLGLYLPRNITIINSFIWVSIGYALASAQGAALAQREMSRNGQLPHGRTILFEGDGSLQMSAQAISDIIRNRLDVIIFVLNNNGYTVERAIHGHDAYYNDIQPWRNPEAPSYFGAPKNDPSYTVITRQIHMLGELEEVFIDPEVQRGKGLVMIEVILDYDDCPDSLRKTAEYVAKRNGGH